jgi:hypothetical protein
MMYLKTKCRIKLLTAVILITSLGSCTLGSANKLQQGDLLFQDLNCGALCDAIESVTEGVNGRDFSHCAVVVKYNDSLMVAEAIGDTVQLNSISSFFRRSGDSNIVVGRLKVGYKSLIPSAEQFILKNMGQPYDDEYVLNNGKLYCSELIYEAFRDENKKPIFGTAPMSFKNPSTKTFDSAWVEYYRKIGKKIPEGLPGINPGLISRSEKIQIIPIKNPTVQKAN